MQEVITERNVNQVFQIAVMLFKSLKEQGHIYDSRNGQVVRHPGILVSRYTHPCERVLFNEIRDCNPFFHFMESLWMLAGRDDVQWIERFNSQMSNYSDDGDIYHGAYGHRWRKRFGMDQLALIVKELEERPNSRRAMLQIWSAKHDLFVDSVDIPCNTMAKFDTRDDKVNLIVFCRSNDMIWGAYGANVVQFSVLLEYIACMLGKEVGTYTQISADAHMYLDTFEKVEKIEGMTDYDEYMSRIPNIKPYALVQDKDSFDDELLLFINDPSNSNKRKYDNGIFSNVGVHIFNAWNKYKEKDYDGARAELDKCEALDWALACQQWIMRRAMRNAAKSTI